MVMGLSDGYVTVKLPQPLADEIDALIKRGVLGYRTRGEFVKEAVRHKLLTISSSKSGEYGRICKEVEG